MSAELLQCGILPLTVGWGRDWHGFCMAFRMTMLANSAPLKWAVILAGLAWAPAVSAKSNDSNKLGSDARICAEVISEVEQVRKIPGQLLLAIALAESGRWDAAKRARFAWPWTVTAGGKGRFFASKTAAIAHVRELQTTGVRNIDVGCMQVNLKYHPKAFANLDQAFDPRVNAAYAGELVDKLRRATRSWTQAVRHYHSNHYKRGQAYWRRVVVIWNSERRIASERQRLARIEQYRRERQARIEQIKRARREQMVVRR